MILKGSCVELKQCGCRYIGDHVYRRSTKSEVCTSTIKIKFCVVHLTGMQEGLIRYIFHS